jgi:5,10-methylenetetrahydrofolate reductase
VAPEPFELVCEIEPPTKPDLKRVRHQIGVLSAVADAFLIPDNHLGRATVSSIAVAHEVEAMGGRSIACLNARDRNLLGFQRDLLTAAAYGVDQFLFVYGDKPTAGERTSELTVRAMIEEARRFAAARGTGTPSSFRLGATASPGKLPAWKKNVDFLFVQVGFSLDAFLRWRDQAATSLPIYAGVMVLASAEMARSLAGSVPEIEIPASLVDAVEADRSAGVAAACDLVLQLRETHAFHGVHLVPVGRYREVAARLEGTAMAKQTHRQ